MMSKYGMCMKAVVLVIALTFMFAGSAGAAMDHGHGMGMHHQHQMLNHALGMALEGSNLVMLGQMGMAKGIDKESVEHGKMMIKNARKVWTETIEGKSMMHMHDSGAGMTDPMMAFTHQLAEAQLKVIDILDKMDSAKQDGHSMSMHHQHQMLNHALKMAVEGSNLVMLGQMGMAKGVDEISVKHGKMMIKNAESLFNEVMSGSAMTGMHGQGVSPDKDKQMAFTHKLAEAQLKVISLLKKMPAAMMHK